MKFAPSFLSFGWLVCFALTSLAQRPRIDKIDPPDWWAGFPSPMLLVHGDGLKRVRFAVNGRRVTLHRVQISENGHWAFLWLETGSAPSQTLWITASNRDGQARHSYRLATRSNDSYGHSGFSSADVLYLIMTDRFAEGTSGRNRPGIDRSAPHGWHGGNLAGIEQPSGLFERTRRHSFVDNSGSLERHDAGVLSRLRGH